MLKRATVHFLFDESPFSSNCTFKYVTMEWVELKDTHGEKAPSNNFSVLAKSITMGIWAGVFKLKQNFQKNKVVTNKTLLFVICQFCTLHFDLTSAF